MHFDFFPLTFSLLPLSSQVQASSTQPSQQIKKSQSLQEQIATATKKVFHILSHYHMMCHMTPLSLVAIAGQRVEADREASLHEDERGVYISPWI